MPEYDPQAHIKALEAINANKLALALAPAEFVAGIFDLSEDPEFLAMAKDYGEGGTEIVERVMAGKAAEYLGQQKDKVKEPAPAAVVVNPAVADFRSKMKGGSK